MLFYVILAISHFDETAIQPLFHFYHIRGKPLLFLNATLTLFWYYMAECCCLIVVPRRPLLRGRDQIPGSWSSFTLASRDSVGALVEAWGVGDLEGMQVCNSRGN